MPRKTTRVEVILRAGGRLCIWIRASAALSISDHKSLLLGAGCVASGVEGVDRIEIGPSNTAECVRRVALRAGGNWRVAFEGDALRFVAREKRVPPDFWNRAKFIGVALEHTLARQVIEKPFTDFEAMAQ